MRLYHNPKCSKSRQAKQVLDQKNISYDVRLYLDNPLNQVELEDLLKRLGLNIKDIIRTKEAIWKESFKGKDLSDQELLEIIANNPRLLERPIIEHKDFAVIARSDEKITEILNTY